MHEKLGTKLLVVIICAMLVFSAISVVAEEKSKKTDKKPAIKKSSTKSKAESKAAETKAPAVKQKLPKPTEPKQPTQLELCKEKPTPREQFECEKEIKTRQELEAFKASATKYEVGPVTFYYNGAKVEKSGSKDLVNLKFLVENSGSKENITLFCTGPSLCNYELSDGTTTYKYSANDFTNGMVVLKPGQSRYINILFGPAIGYGSYTDFKFDPSKQYTFNIKEPWGSAKIPLNLK